MDDIELQEKKSQLNECGLEWWASEDTLGEWSWVRKNFILKSFIFIGQMERFMSTSDMMTL